VAGAPNRALVLRFALPYVAYVGIASIPPEWLARDWNYVARILVTTAALLWAWPRLVPLRGPGSARLSVGAGLIAGVVGVALWIALMTPFVGEGEPWDARGWWLRLFAAVMIVPLFEEQLMRGFLLRFGVQWGDARKAGHKDAFGEAFDKRSVLDVDAGRVTLLGAALSIVLFTLGHHMTEWAAAVAYGGLMVWLYAWRRDLLGCVVAHATTNVLLALYVRGTGAWGFC